MRHSNIAKHIRYWILETVLDIHVQYKAMYNSTSRDQTWLTILL